MEGGADREQTESELNDRQEKLCEEETGCDRVLSNKGGKGGVLCGQCAKREKKKARQKRSGTREAVTLKSELDTCSSWHYAFVAPVSSLFLSLCLKHSSLTLSCALRYWNDRLHHPRPLHCPPPTPPPPIPPPVPPPSVHPPHLPVPHSLC